MLCLGKGSCCALLLPATPQSLSTLSKLCSLKPKPSASGLQTLNPVLEALQPQHVCMCVHTCLDVYMYFCMRGYTSKPLQPAYNLQPKAYSVKLSASNPQPDTLSPLQQADIHIYLGVHMYIEKALLLILGSLGLSGVWSKPGPASSEPIEHSRTLRHKP